ncbi:MAG: hypothetical protein ABI690_21115 [Chloroflexota bacterium]
MVDNCEIVAAVAGGKREKRRRIENFMGGKSAGGEWSAAGLAAMRREYETELPLHKFRPRCREQQVLSTDYSKYSR